MARSTLIDSVLNRYNPEYDNPTVVGGPPVAWYAWNLAMQAKEALEDAEALRQRVDELERRLTELESKVNTVLS